MLFFGGLAILLTVFLLGTFWPHKTAMPLGATVWGYFVKSLFLSWIWFYISYHTSFGDIARPMTVLSIIVACGLLLSRQHVVRIPLESSLRFSRFTDVVMVTLFLVLAMPALSGIGSTFTEWDAVVSWNRWATELSKNSYYPMNAAYPVLWPAVWSLIYEAQGNTEIWYLTKASIGAPVLFFACYAAYKIKTHGLASTTLLCALVYLAFITQSIFIVSGYMDIPLSLLGLAALLLTLDAIDADNQKLYREYILLATITVSMAVLTKQGGVLIGGVVGALVFWEFLRKRLSFKYMIGLGAIVLFPALTYVQLFFSRQTSLWGNTDALLAVASGKRGDANVFLHAYKTIFDSIPEIILPLLAFGIVLNFVFARSRRGAFGILAFIVGCVTFIVFAQCCAYGVRNGYVIFALLITSAFVGYSSTEQWLVSRWHAQKSEKLMFTEFDIGRPILLMVGAVVVSIMMLAVEWPVKDLSQKHLNQQYAAMGSSGTNAFIRDNREIIKRYNRFVTYYVMAQHFPETRFKYSFCIRTEKSCVESNINRWGTLLVFSANWRETPETKKYIEESIKNGVAKELAKSGSNALYEFKKP